MYILFPFQTVVFIGNQFTTCTLLNELYFVTINTMRLCDRFRFEAFYNFNIYIGMLL